MNRSNLSLIQCSALLAILYCVTAAIFYLANTTEYLASDQVSGIKFWMFVLLSPIVFKYVVQLSVSPFYSSIEKSRALSGDVPQQPTVSVLIPAWNEQVGIIKTLRSVLATQYKNLEVVVINDGSSDGTHQLVTEFIQDYEKSEQTKAVIKYLRLPNGGKAKAMNQGLQLASGEFVITIDADSVMDKRAISNFIKRFTDKKVAAVAGNVIVGNRRKPIEVMQQLEYMYGFFFKRAESNFNSVYIIGGAAAAYRKSVLIEIGGFDQDIITEDVEMSIRILAHGYKTRYAADAAVFTEGPSEWTGLCNQRLRWKFGKLLTFIKHRNLFFSNKQQHNPYLTYLLLPLAVYAEIALLFEGLLLTIFYGYTIYTNDYFPLVFLITFMASLLSLQVLFDPKTRFHINLLLLAPVAWIVFYVIDIVEYQALYRSLKRFVKREELEWQRWVRVGIISRSVGRSQTATESE